MSLQRRSVLDRGTVKSPCTEDWDAMRGNDEIRFCSHCAKDVHNLSGMTRTDAEALIRKSNGRLCVRYVTRADKTIVSAPPVDTPLLKHARRASKLAASAFTAALTFTPAANAQTSVTLNQTTHAETPNQQPAAQIGSGSTAIVGTVIDQSGAVIPNVKITLNYSSGAVQTTQANEEGYYRFDNLANGTYTINFESIEVVGFKKLEVIDISLEKGMEKRIDAVLEVSGEYATMGIVAMSPSPAEAFVYHKAERAAFNNYDSEVKDPLLEPFNEIANGELKKVKVLLRSGFDVNTRWHDDTTPLMVVGNGKVAKFLIRLGADVHARKVYGETALMSASHNPEVVAALLKAGAGVNARDNFGVTPLMYAMLGYDEKSAQVLIDAGADVNARDKDNRTALMFAAMEGRVGTIKVLLAAKAEHDVRDVDGKTALMFATENNHEEAIKVLCAGGAVE